MQTRPAMIDFHSMAAALALVSIIPLSDSPRGPKGLSEGGCPCRFSLYMVPRCLSMSLAGELSSVAARGTVVVCKDWEARETKAMSIYSLGRRL
jgi:hypothetical protein